MHNIKTVIFIIVLTSLFLFGCSVDDKNNKMFLPVSVTVNVDETILQNASNSFSCFDDMGISIAKAYIFENSDSALDDIDGIAPDPFQVIDITDLSAGVYSYEITFQDTGTFRSGITCEAQLDNPVSDDNISLFYFQKIRLGNINDVDGETVLPEGHYTTTTDCLECHILGDHSDLMDMNHNFAIGMCADCHDGPTI
ncbi:hypothetical protein [Kaarinaea lacus]